MSAIAGRVLLIPKGNYDSTATYTMLDMVVYNGSSYICKQECTGVVPTNTTYWMLNASGSAVAFLNDIGDVVITNVSNGQVLMYDSTTQKWVNGTISTTLSGLSDTQIESLSNEQVLKYDSASSKWVNADNELSDLSDANISSATNGQSLIYNSTSQKWENGNGTLSDLSDTNISSVANGQILKYDSASSKWKNAEQSIWTTPVSCAIGDTTCTIQNANILTTSIIDYYTENASDTPINAKQVITAGQDVLTFDALEEATSIRLHIINL